MANQVAARLSGDDYQHLYAWQLALELMQPRKQVWRVTIEDALAGSVDDVTVQHTPGAQLPERFYQVKYHVDQRDVYSTDSLIAHKPGHTSLLQKFWNSWQLLRQPDHARPVELHLASNWTWDSHDPLKACFDGHDTSVKPLFFESSARSAIGQRRQRWQQALNASDEDFAAFIGSLRFRLGFDCGDELAQRTAERMEGLGLQCDAPALLVAAGIVRSWIKAGRQALERADLEAALCAHNLYAPADNEASVTIYLTTVKRQTYALPPDYNIDWREHFIEEGGVRGHRITDPAHWNGLLLPELRAVSDEISQETTRRLVRARGLARLSAWFAFGFTFSEVARYTIEVDQYGKLWRTDAPRSMDLTMIAPPGIEPQLGESLDGTGTTVAVGISVTDSLEVDVRDYLDQRTEPVAALLLLQPNRALGPTCFRDAGDVAAFAEDAKRMLRAFVRQWRAQRLLLFYFGPLSGACFLGHQLNALCPIQIMEDQRPGYAPAFLLR